VLLARFQPQPENPGRTMAWNKHARDGPMLATGTGDGSVRLWSPKNLEPSIAESHDGHVTAGIFTPYSVGPKTSYFPSQEANMI
jgi:WD40 repeat protein